MDVFEYECEPSQVQFTLKDGPPPAVVKVTGEETEHLKLYPRQSVTVDVTDAVWKVQDDKVEKSSATRSFPAMDPQADITLTLPGTVGVPGQDSVVEAVVEAASNSFIDGARPWEFTVDTVQLLNTGAAIVAHRSWQTGYTRKAWFLITGVIARSLPQFKLTFTVGWHHKVQPDPNDVVTIGAYARVYARRLSLGFIPIFGVAEDDRSLRTESCRCCMLHRRSGGSSEEVSLASSSSFTDSCGVSLDE